MDGGTGDDTYYVDNEGDTAIEDSPDGGWDFISASVDFTLGANIESLQLTDDAISGTGNELDNQIQGNDSDNILSGLDGNDYLDGGAGNDTISGGEGNDSIYGGSDNEVYIDGNWQHLDNADTLDGGAGDDIIDGGSGSDLIFGGAGDDYLFGGYDGGEGGNSLTNDDTIYGGDGNDNIDGGSGADKLYGGAGDDVIYGGDNNWSSTVYDPATDTYTDMSNADVIDGGDGNDTIYGQAGDDLLSGGAGDDEINGGDGNDLLDGGAGVDDLIGGQGDDVYVVDGSYVKMADVPTLSDCGHMVLKEQLVWTTDAVTEYGDDGYDVVFSSASCALTDNVEELRLTFDPDMEASDPQQYADLLAFGQNGFGNELDNVIVGDELGNRLEGGAGNDVLVGGAGDDTLVGDAGNDTLMGGEGDDRYVFRLGDGADTIVDSQGRDTLHIGSGVTLADVQVVNDNGDMALSILGTDDSIVLSNWFGQTEGVNTIEFCDGTVLDRPELASMTNWPNPDNPLPDQTTLEDESYTFAIPADAFSYSSSVDGDTLFYSATMADGGALPAWLALDSASGIFSGTPDNWDVNTLSLTVTATNASGHAASSSFELDVLNVNDAPVVVNMAADQNAIENKPLSFAIPADAFNDDDFIHGDSLTYSATLADGGALPGWLSFDAATQTFSGTPGNSAVGTLNLAVTATDTGGLTASGLFNLAVASVNVSPTVADDVGTAQEDNILTVVGNVLSNDTDSNAGTVLAVADAGVRQGSLGTLTLSRDGSYRYDLDNASLAVQSLGIDQNVVEQFGYHADDGSFVTPGELSITVMGQNDIPVLVKPLSDQQFAKNTDVGWTIPANSFTDIDRSDTLSYSATLASGSALPSWLKFDAATQTFSGHVPSNAKGSLDIRVTASDGHGADSFAADVFSVGFGKDGGCGKGNEGLGNGQDAPPPGHDSNRNDGPGTSPGHPGSCGGNSQDDSHSGPGQSCDSKNNSEKNSGGKGKSNSPSYVDLKLVDQHRDAFGSDMERCGTSAANDETGYYRNWVAVDLKVSSMMADNNCQPSWLDPAHGADIGGFGGLAHNTSEAGNRGGVDAVSLVAGSGTCLKGFRGLQEGMARLG